MRFWIPIDSIEKSKNKEGKEVMRLAGIASTYDEDTDGEFLDPNGFDYNYFKDYGHVNWNHMATEDPSKIAGYPSKVEINKSGMYVEVDLLHNKIGKQIYELAQAYKEHPESNRGLGFSVEGRAIERDTVNPKIVKKAKITGLAITHQPKNCSTYADIIKSMSGKAEMKNKQKEKEDSDEDEDDAEIAESISENENESIEKTDTVSIRPSTPEALDNEMKVLDYPIPNSNVVKKSLSKKELKDNLSIILKDSSTVEIIKNLLNMKNKEELEKAVKPVEVIEEQDEISKAFANLGIEGVTIKKAQDSDKMESQSDSSNEEDETGEGEDEDVEDKEESDGAEGSKIKKSTYVDADLIKSLVDELHIMRVDNTEMSSRATDIAKSQAVIIKGLYDQMNQLRESVNELRNQPMQRKSITRTPIEHLEKSFAPDLETVQTQNRLTSNQVNLYDKIQVTELLFDLFKKSNNDGDKAASSRIENTIAHYDMYTKLPDDIMHRIRIEKGIEIVS